MTQKDSDNPLAIEIRQEQAATYFAACRKMLDSLEKLRTFDQVASSPKESERTRRRAELLEAAAERVHFVIIQREAMKLSWSETFFEDYDIPAEVRNRLGWPQRR